MIRYVARRLLQMVLVLGVISFVRFMLFWAGPRRPAREICNYHCTAQGIEEINHTYGFDGRSWSSTPTT